MCILLLSVGEIRKIRHHLSQECMFYTDNTDVLKEVQIMCVNNCTLINALKSVNQRLIITLEY